jgi:hypothetical protein
MSRYTVIVLTRIIDATSATVRNLAFGSSCATGQPLSAGGAIYDTYALEEKWSLLRRPNRLAIMCC